MNTVMLNFCGATDFIKYAIALLTRDNAYCILGRNAAGEVVASQAARVYEWPQTSFYDEVTSMRLFYRDPESMRVAGEEVRVTALATRHITGTVAYSGAGWYRPDHRGGLLSNLIPRISRALTLAQWGVAFTTAIMHETVVAKKLIARSGHRNVHYCPAWKDAPDLLRDEVGPHDVVITLGAGDVNRLAQTLADEGDTA